MYKRYNYMNIFVGLCFIQKQSVQGFVYPDDLSRFWFISPNRQGPRELSRISVISPSLNPHVD